MWVAGAAAAGALAVPAQALADDQGVYDAWVADDAQYAKLAKDLRQAERRWESSGFVRAGRFLATVRHISRVVHRTKVRMSHQDPSSDQGRRAENLALRGLDLFRASILNRGRAMRAFMRFDGYNYIRLNRKSRGQLRRSASKESQARKAFKRAGVKLK
jgi:hypothetical protein